MSTSDDNRSVMVEGATLIFRNFSGREDQYNRAGDRNFSVILEPDVAEDLLKLGWNVKELPSREEGEPPTSYITVAVSYKIRPPRIVMMTSRARTNLDEASVEVLDWAEIADADLIFRPYDWVVGDKKGTKAYLQSLFITIEEDALERKYAVNDVGEMER